MDVITFNTLLFPAAIELTPGRLEAATDMIVDADADVLCLQEVFLPDEIDYVQDKLEAAGYEVYVDFLQVFADEIYQPCTQADIAPVFQCFA